MRNYYKFEQKKICEYLQKGNDSEGRAFICSELHGLINKSNGGLIGLAGIKEGLEEAIKKVDIYMDLFDPEGAE